MKLKQLVRIAVAGLGLVAAGAFAAPAPADPSVGFNEQFSSATLDPAWTVVPGTRSYYPGFGQPVNDYSLTASPGHLRYTLNPMSHPYGFLNGYQAAPPPQLNVFYGYDPGLEIWRPISGSSWLLEAKVSYYLPCTNGRELDLFVEFGPGGTGSTMAGFVRARDTDCVNWGGNNFQARVVSQPGTTAGDLVHEGAAESLPIGDPVTSTYHLRLKRDGGMLTWSRSTDGVTWSELFNKNFGTGLDGLDQRVTIVGHSWFNPGGSYADWDYITVTPLDQTPPAITIAQPANAAAYPIGSSIAADYSCTDAAAVASCVGTVSDGIAIDTATVGPKTFTVTAQDTTGNQSSLTHQYSVVYPFTGFFPPLDNPPTLNRVKAGAAVPIKFSLNGYHGLDIFAQGSPTSRAIACDSGAPLDDVEETVTAGSSSLSYDSILDRYVYIWKTSESWAGTCRQLEVTLNDGTSHLADLQFK